MMPVPTALLFRPDGDAAVGDAAVSPPRDEKWTDASKLTFPLQMVIMIIGVVVSSYMAAWSAQSSQRDAMAAQREAIVALASDIRDIRTQLDGQKENLDLKLANLRLEVQNSELRKALLDELKANTQ